MTTSAPQQSPIQNRWFFQSCDVACLWIAGYFMGVSTDFYTKFFGNCTPFSRANMQSVCFDMILFILRMQFMLLCITDIEYSTKSVEEKSHHICLRRCFPSDQVCGYLNKNLIFHGWKKVAVASLLPYTSFTNASNDTLVSQQSLMRLNYFDNEISQDIANVCQQIDSLLLARHLTTGCLNWLCTLYHTFKLHMYASYRLFDSQCAWHSYTSYSFHPNSVNNQKHLTRIRQSTK
ncbi:unnamed protein product [Albugo candida]|uniref:Uncharacterized protein n=1 Tax=Albugo candida TaxID=65357 RepID=A0A024GTH8_9STRA|nr:unnamed protein product [Albugo candida]|eukprot:CCI50098.1 unnamed protein product [Albugo candida]